MKQRLCLHGIDIRHQAQLIGLIKKLLPDARLTYKVKEKYFNDNDMYKCRIARFEPRGFDGYRVICLWGVLLVSDKLVNIADIVLEYDAANEQAAAAVQKLLPRLLEGKLRFVLEEPELSQRIDLLRGCYCLDKLSAYAADRALSVLASHIPWQLYGISKLWEQLLLTEGAQRPLWRQLRVKLRRLRSFVSLVKPLLPSEAAAQCQQLLKDRAQRLSAVRECDVLLVTCTRLRTARDEQNEAAPESALPQLQRLLENLRREEQQKALKGLKLNALTLELAQLQLFLAVQSCAANSFAKISMQEFFEQRLSAWAAKLFLLPQKYPDIHNMEHLHRVRIKLKRFRYALQSVPELKASNQLLRSLKYLQDMLGLLHDDYVNEQQLMQLVKAHPELPELRYEAALLRGWEQGKADAALQQLPSQWQSFSELLQSWCDELD